MLKPQGGRSREVKVRSSEGEEGRKLMRTHAVRLTAPTVSVSLHRRLKHAEYHSARPRKQVEGVKVGYRCEESATAMSFTPSSTTDCR
jgi:hypothetical protein